MRRKIFQAFVATAAITFLSSASVNAEPNETKIPEIFADGSSYWVNQEGSTMAFTLRPTTRPDVLLMDGTYVNNAEGFGCQGTPYPLSGVLYLGSMAMSFSVAWSNGYAVCSSVTGWTGYYSSDDKTIRTDWNLAYYDKPGHMAITSGSDSFTAKSSMKHSSPFDK